MENLKGQITRSQCYKNKGVVSCALRQSRKFYATFKTSGHSRREGRTGGKCNRGAQMDSHLSFQMHSDSVCRKALQSPCKTKPLRYYTKYSNYGLSITLGIHSDFQHYIFTIFSPANIVENCQGLLSMQGK